MLKYVEFLPRGGEEATLWKSVTERVLPILWPVRPHNNSDCNFSNTLVKICLSHLPNTHSEHSSDCIHYFVSLQKKLSWPPILPLFHASLFLVFSFWSPRKITSWFLFSSIFEFFLWSIRPLSKQLFNTFLANNIFRTIFWSHVTS